MLSTICQPSRQNVDSVTKLEFINVNVENTKRLTSDELLSNNWRRGKAKNLERGHRLERFLWCKTL